MTGKRPTAAPPMVSVILPCYNVAEYIGTAIDSLKAQTFENFEALVVNDGSTDASADIVRAAIAGDARFRLLSQRRQGCQARATPV